MTDIVETNEIESLRAEIESLRGKVRWIEEGPGSIVGFPWDTPYMDGLEEGKTTCREQINVLEDEIESLRAEIESLRKQLVESHELAIADNVLAQQAWALAEYALKEAIKQAKREAYTEVWQRWDDQESQMDFDLWLKERQVAP
jgi:hypothetical protein